MVIANLIAYIILIIGGLNWGLVGIFNFNLVSTIFGAYPAVGTIIVYVLVAVSAIWLIISPILTNGKLYLITNNNYENKNDEFLKCHFYIKKQGKVLIIPLPCFVFIFEYMFIFSIVYYALSNIPKTAAIPFGRYT